MRARATDRWAAVASILMDFYDMDLVKLLAGPHHVPLVHARRTVLGSSCRSGLTRVVVRTGAGGGCQVRLNVSGVGEAFEYRECPDVAFVRGSTGS